MKTLDLKAPSFKTIALCGLQAIALAALVHVAAIICGVDEYFIGFDESTKNLLQRSWIALIPLFALPIAGKLAAESTDNPRLIYNPLLRWPIRIGAVIMSAFFFIALKNKYLQPLGQANNDPGMTMFAIFVAFVIAYLLYSTVRWYVKDRRCFRSKPVLDAFLNWLLPITCGGAMMAGFALALLIAGAAAAYIMSAVVRRY